MTTKLSAATKAVSLNELRTLLNNVVGFVECPITDRTQMVELWNTKYPADVREAVRVLGIYNIGMGNGNVTTEALRWCTEIDGVLHSAFVNLTELGPLSAEKIRQGVMQYAFGTTGGLTKHHRGVHLADSFARYLCHEFTAQDMAKVLGVDLTDEVISWMKQTAIMRNELIIANTALQSIFDMAQTAGQIKRMVPDLLQYLPARQRLAFEEQKRSSTVPFDWAPFPKEHVDVMLAQINKGHLLQNMRKPNRQQVSVELIDRTTWTRTDCKWAA